MIAWLSLDENDNLLPRFFTYFIAAVQTVYPDFGQALLSSLQMSSPPSDEAIGQALLHELAMLAQPLLLVLDDYHVINNESIHAALRKLIAYMPPGLHLVITTREEPPFPLSRLRVQGHLVEIRAADLRFTMDEATAFFQQIMGLHLNESIITALENRTEGWIAGLQLAALSLSNAVEPQNFIADFNGSSRHVADYLVEGGTRAPVRRSPGIFCYKRLFWTGFAPNSAPP